MPRVSAQLLHLLFRHISVYFTSFSGKTWKSAIGKIHIHWDTHFLTHFGRHSGSEGPWFDPQALTSSSGIILNPKLLNM